MQSQGAGHGPAGSHALAQYRQRAARYDAELAPFAQVRHDAIARLQLHPREHAIDVGCGTGLSFEELRAAVGDGGRVTGIEPSPEMLEQARLRIARHRWRNVALSAGFAAQARLRGKADAALFLFTHDVLRDPAAIAHVLAHLRPGARVVACGLQWAPAWCWPANGFVMLAALYSVSSLEGMGRPWDLLEAQLGPMEVQPAGIGGIYYATGTLP